MFRPGIFLKDIENFVRKTFLKSLEKEEGRWNMNFFPRPESVEFLKSYNFNLVKDMTDELAKDLRSTLERQYVNNASKAQVKAEMAKIFNKNENRIDAIYQTETNRIGNVGKLEAAKQSELNLKKEVRIVEDDRTTPLCKRMNSKYKGSPIPLGDKFKDKQTGGEWDAPPFHVNCRSNIRTVQVEEE